ncbi:MAG: hypothetical protein EAZ87_15545 [Nostocales cyanobacterium]|nr:MAG: hypothetical protein EAZ87_15545 [Nostocales cyanobacterium]
MSVVLSFPLVANADQAFQQFMKNQVAEFNGDKAPEKCKEKQLEIVESGNKILYQLCAIKNKPIYLRGSIDGTPISFYEFKNSKIVQSTGIDGGVSVGYRNEKPVVIWDFFNETIYFKIDEETKKIQQQDLIKIKKILQRFGIQTSTKSPTK